MVKCGVRNNFTIYTDDESPYIIDKYVHIPERKLKCKGELSRIGTTRGANLWSYERENSCYLNNYTAEVRLFLKRLIEFSDKIKELSNKYESGIITTISKDGRVADFIIPLDVLEMTRRLNVQYQVVCSLCWWRKAKSDYSSYDKILSISFYNCDSRRKCIDNMVYLDINTKNKKYFIDKRTVNNILCDERSYVLLPVCNWYDPVESMIEKIFDKYIESKVSYSFIGFDIHTVDECIGVVVSPKMADMLIKMGTSLRVRIKLYSYDHQLPSHRR